MEIGRTVNWLELEIWASAEQSIDFILENGNENWADRLNVFFFYVPKQNLIWPFDREESVKLNQYKIRNNKIIMPIPSNWFHRYSPLLSHILCA